MISLPNDLVIVLRTRESGGPGGESVWQPTGSGFRGVSCCAVLFCGFQAEQSHVQNDAQINNDNERREPGGMPIKVGDFERDVERAGGDGEPFRPRIEVPQSVGLNETKGYVDRCNYCDLPQVDVTHAVYQVNEHADDAAVGIEVKELEKAFGYAPDISMPHGKKTEACQNHQETLCELKGRDGANAFDMFRIVDSGMH